MSVLSKDAEVHYVTVVRTEVVEVILRANDADDAVERALASASLDETTEWVIATEFVDRVQIIDGEGNFVQLQVEKI